MISSAFTLQKTGTWAALAACLMLPSLGEAQTVRNASTQPAITAATVNPIVASSPQDLAQNVAQTTNYSVEPVYVDGSTMPAGGGDLANPVYASPEVSATRQTQESRINREFAPMPANAQVVAPSELLAPTQAVAQAPDSDPNNGLVKVEMVKVGESVTTTTTRTTQLAANPTGSTQAEGFGWRLNALNPASARLPLGLAGDGGAYASFQPNWEGSAEHMFLALPYADIQLGNRVYLSTDRGLGLNLLASRNAAVSVAADFRFPRMDLDVLKPLDDVDGALTVGGRVNLYIQELELFLNTDIGVYGEMSGWDVELGLSSVQPITDRLAIKVTGAVSAADAELLNNMFQVTAADAALLSVPEYNVDRFGLKDMRVKGEVKYFFTDHIGLYGASQVKVLLDAAADSPLVDDLGDAVQFSSNLGLIYRF